jgi:hypothetical protein
MHGAIDSSIAQVFGVVARVRNRWRLARVVRGAAVALAGIVVTLVAASLILEASNYAANVVVAARAMLAVVAVALIGWCVVRPMLPRPGDDQVALYVEEHEPTLEGALVSAVEVSGSGATARPISSAIAERVRGMAIERSQAIGGGRRVDARGSRLAFASLAAASATLLMVLTFGPDSLRYGMGALLTPWKSAETVNPFRLDILPGDATVARGASVVISAMPVGFQPGSAELWARTSDTTQWRRIPMSGDSTARFSARLLDVSAATEYLVETNGLRSRTFKLSVADLPYARRLDLEYRFPAYTGLPVQQVDSSGDIAAVAGTMVRVRVTPTRPTAGGRLVVENGDTLALTPNADGTLVATLRVRAPGFYRVELEGAGGNLLTASLNYAIDVLPDRPPTVRLSKPGRDTKVLAVDEVYTEARAEDDYGVSRLDMVYSVNGGPEKVAPLHQATRAIRDIAAGHTFMLEEHALVPGDVVSYYARATDNDAVSGAKSVTSDIYFMQVRPYSQNYRQEQGGGGGGGGGGGNQDNPGQLSQRQRDIIAATFNAMRDSATAPKKTMEEDMATLRLAQQRLREDVEQLATRLVQRGIASNDSNFARIAAILPSAAAAMDTVEKTLADNRLRPALQPEQRALQQLQRAEAVFRDVRVQMGQEGGGGGGGGGQQQQAEDLADLFELQRERMRNQYETLQRDDQDEQQQANQEVDATAERLKQLAARLQQENERARRKADSLSGARGASGASGGDAQRQLAQETEQAARQLERLARERQSQELADAARRLNESADAMRRAAANGGQRGNEQAQSALERLRDARRLLEQEQDNRVQRSVEDAARSARRLAQEQERVANDVARQNSGTEQEREELRRAIAQRKGELADSTRALGTRLDRMSLDAQREQPSVAREIKEAADTLRARRIEDKIRITQNSLGDTPQEYQNLNERLITSDIGQFNRTLEEAQRAAQSARGADGERKNADAMDRARDLVRGMESLDERLRQQQQRAQGQQGQEQQGQGQQGQQGQGQQGQGQQGQGQQGQQGQGQQGQGQQGQQGQGQNSQGGQPGGGQPGLGQGRTGAQNGDGGFGGGQGGPPVAAGPMSGQINREMRERLNDARALRRELSQRGGVDLEQLDRAIGQMESIARGVGSNADPRAAGELRSQVIDGLRSFEFQLGRAFGQVGGERVTVDRAGEIPPEYRKAVEEYYRSLGRAKPRP